MLQEQYIYEKHAAFLLGKDEFKPFATAGEREFWESLPEEVSADRIAKGELYLNYNWPCLPASRYMDYIRDGNRNRFEEIYFKKRFALGTMAVAECVEGKGRFLDDIINGIWSICEESAWNLSAHNDGLMLPDIKNPIIDLFAAETGALLSWTVYLLKRHLDAVSPMICERIVLEVKRRILDPYLSRDDFWWMCFHLPYGYSVNNWNPWCNSNCLAAFLLLEEDQERREQAVEKSIKSMDIFLDSYHTDGGCDEGTSYWAQAGGSLFDFLELLYLVSDGRISFYNEVLVKNIGRFIYHSHISRDNYINFADGGAKVNLPSELVYRYGLRIGDEKLMNLGVHSFRISKYRITVPEFYPVFRMLSSLKNYKIMKQSKTGALFVRDVWLDGIQVMAAREQEGSDQGLYLAAKGGHNGESHNHNDIGQFILYSDGKPAIIDIGVETYTAKTFSDRRYEIWTMQSGYHNLPTVNGFLQQSGKEYAALDVLYSRNDSQVCFSLDISSAYPKEAGLEAWIRSFAYHRLGKAHIEIVDDFKLNREAEVFLSLMTAYRPSCVSPGVVLLPVDGARDIKIEFSCEALTYSCEKISITDARLQPMWGVSLYRILLKSVRHIDRARWSMKITQVI